MPTYRAPLKDMHFLLFELFKAPEQFINIPEYSHVDEQTIRAILEQAAHFAEQEIFPLNIPGDRQGCTYNPITHTVHTPEGFKTAYQTFCSSGWSALSCSAQYGGQALPQTLNQCLYEMLNSANQAWTMYPGLSHGAYECLSAHGTEEQKSVYLPHLVDGSWSGTMCLTEPHCGTDLGLLTTKLRFTCP